MYYIEYMHINTYTSSSGMDIFEGFDEPLGLILYSYLFNTVVTRHIWLLTWKF